MVGLNKFTDKERRKARRSFQSDPYKSELRTPKYKQRLEKPADRHGFTHRRWEEEDEE